MTITMEKMGDGSPAGIRSNVPGIDIEKLREAENLATRYILRFCRGLE